MFERTSRLAENLATSVSRRGFLDSAGRWAGATALGLAGVLNTAAARADSSATCCYCCDVDASCSLIGCVKTGGPCPPCPTGTYLWTVAVKNCSTDCRTRCKRPCGGGA
jgi:hypothetical protein